MTSSSPVTRHTRLSGRRSPFNIAVRARVIFVVAYERNGTIGKDGRLPWHLPADLRHFKALTIGKPVIMGRKTYASIGKPLPKRRNIVLTHARDFAADGIETAGSPQDVFAMTRGAAEIAVIGGAKVFETFAPFVDSVYATEVQADLPGDVRYASPQRDCTQTVLGEHAADESNAYAMRFMRYDYTPSPEVR